MLKNKHLLSLLSYFLTKNEVSNTSTTKPTNPPFPNDVISEVILATTSIPNTEPPVKMYHKIVTGSTAIKTVLNPPTNPVICLITLSIIFSFFLSVYIS